MENTEEQLAKIIPKEYLKALAEAHEIGALGITLVLDRDVVEKIKRNESAAIFMDDGGVILMFTQASLEKIYVESV